jgi:DNA-binding response OmpR family regulator
MLKKTSGYEICKEIRQTSDVPIIFISALHTICHQLKALEIGGTDFIIKPFSLDEIEKRIILVLNKNDEQENEIIKLNNIEIHLKKKFLLKNEKKFILTPIEIKFIQIFLNNKGKILKRDDLISYIWGTNYYSHIDVRIVDVYISRIRIKIEENPSNPVFLKTIRGIGYKFC